MTQVVCFPRRVAQAVAKREDRAVDEAEEEDAVVATAKEDAQKQYQRRDEVNEDGSVAPGLLRWFSRELAEPRCRYSLAATDVATRESARVKPRQ